MFSDNLSDFSLSLSTKPPPSSSSSSSEEDQTFRNVLIILFYSLIIFISFCGNLLVCKVAFGKPKMRTTTNMLIGNLACSDILMTTINIPFNVARLLLDNWPFGQLVCFLIPFLQVACVYVSTFTMTVIAIHRWWTITKRVSNRSFSPWRITLIVISIWALAMSFSLPHSMFNEIKQVVINNKSLIRCRVTYPSISFLPKNFNYRLFLTIEVFLTQYLTPLVITCIVYIKIAFVVSKQGRLATNTSDERRRQQSDAKRRRITMLALVVCVFALCWLPLNVYYLLVDFKVIGHHFKLFITCHWFAMSSVCYNPFIYCWLNQSFRKAAKKFLRLFFHCSTSQFQSQSSRRINDGQAIECHDEPVTTVNHLDNKKHSIPCENV